MSPWYHVAAVVHVPEVTSAECKRNELECKRNELECKRDELECKRDSYIAGI